MREGGDVLDDRVVIIDPNTKCERVAISLDLTRLFQNVIEAFVTLYSEIVNVGQMNQLALEMKLENLRHLLGK